MRLEKQNHISSHKYSNDVYVSYDFFFFIPWGTAVKMELFLFLCHLPA